MPIVCPNCTTSYDVDSTKLGTSRQVRCARCKEVWTAHPTRELVIAGDVRWSDEAASGPQGDLPALGASQTPVIESPSIAAGEAGTGLVPAGPSQVIDVAQKSGPTARSSKRRRGGERRARSSALIGLPTSVAAMGALIAALLIWRSDVVRLMPQTATFYKTIGLDVNLRGLSFRDVKLGNETVEGKPVLVIEGAIIDELKRPLEIPKLRFVVRDAMGTAVYAWNSAPDQTVIEPGQRVEFRSRLAQPPEDAHSVDVRFFHKRDLAAGAA